MLESRRIRRMDEVLGGDADAAVGLWLGPSTGTPRLSVYCPATYRSLVPEASSSGRGSICELNISSSSAKACSNGALRRAIFRIVSSMKGSPGKARPRHPSSSASARGSPRPASATPGEGRFSDRSDYEGQHTASPRHQDSRIQAQRDGHRTHSGRRQQ